MAKKPKINELYRSRFVVWGGLLLSQFLFLVIGYTTKPNLLYFDISKPPFGADPIAMMVLCVIGFSAIVASFVVRNALISSAINARDIQKLQSAYIVGMAIAEIVSFIGLIAAVVFDNQYFAVFVLVAAIAIFFHRPKMTDVIAATFVDKI
ncbi:MAG: hypothetical protein KF756_04655 [Acidobacteria bacterium]|nr:hypothetical protein [Acidobacteriota bacterium]